MRNNTDVLYSNSKRYPDLTVCKYIHSNVDFSNDFTRTARGLVLDKNNNVIIRGFEKFFNYKELENKDFYTQDFLNLYKVVPNKKYKAFTKQDGTFITVSHYNNKIICGTTGSLDTEFSINAEKHFSQIAGLLDYLKDSNTTLMFEYTSPYNRIVLSYNDTQYILLGEIKNELNTEPITDLSHLDKFNFNKNKYNYFTLEELLNICEKEENIEGFVVTNENNKMIKFKTAWYFNEHKTTNLFMGGQTHNKLKMLFNAYIENNIDDIIALRNQFYDNLGTLYILNFAKLLTETENKIRQIFNDTQHLSDKEFALSDYDTFIKSLVFRLRKTKTVFSINNIDRDLNYFENLLK